MKENLTDRQIQIEIYEELGECYTHVGNFGQAAEHFEKVIELDHQNEKPYIGLGVITLQQSNPIKAKEYFLKAIRLNPRSDKALSGLGMALSWNGSQEEGLKKFQEALYLNPENMPALMGILQCAHVLNELPIAENYLKKYLALHVADLKVLYCLAGVYFKLGKHKEAQEALDKILIFEPENQDALSLRQQIRKGTQSNEIDFGVGRLSTECPREQRTMGLLSKCEQYRKDLE